jgi:hypothetical protein
LEEIPGRLFLLREAAESRLAVPAVKHVGATTSHISIRNTVKQWRFKRNNSLETPLLFSGGKLLWK